MSLNQLQHNIYNFLEKANNVLSEADSLWYSGQFATGKIESPEVLFISINPGYEQKFWEARNKTLQPQEFKVSPCKYRSQDYLLANRIVDVILNGQPELLIHCAETYITSIFNTPDIRILSKSLKQLPSKLLIEHNNISNEIIKLIKPKHIICIGMSAFNEYLSRFGKNGYLEPEIRSALSKSGKSRPIYLKKTIIDGVPVYGVIHLSGAYPSTIALNELKKEFRNLFK